MDRDRDAPASSISSTSSSDKSKAVSNLHKIPVGRLVDVDRLLLTIFLSQQDHSRIHAFSGFQKCFHAHSIDPGEDCNALVYVRSMSASSDSKSYLCVLAPHIAQSIACTSILIWYV